MGQKNEHLLVTGISGSGKSELVKRAIHLGLLKPRLLILDLQVEYDDCEDSRLG